MLGQDTISNLLTPVKAGEPATEEKHTYSRDVSARQSSIVQSASAALLVDAVSTNSHMQCQLDGEAGSTAKVEDTASATSSVCNEGPKTLSQDTVIHLLQATKLSREEQALDCSPQANTAAMRKVKADPSCKVLASRKESLTAESNIELHNEAMSLE